jgi:hypothetical protein
MRIVVLALVALAWVAWPRPAAACATCSCGDPTITSMGTEQSFAGRLRLSLGYSHRSDRSGAPRVDEEARGEDRLDLNVAYSPTKWLQLAATLPLVQRTVTEVDLDRDTLRGSGDLDLRARLTVWTNRRFAPRHTVGLLAGATLPTAGVREDAMGEALDLDHQLGGLALTPRAGVYYLQLVHPWSLYASVSAAHVVKVAGDEKAGDHVNATAAAQWQPGETWGVRLAVDGKLEDRASDGRGGMADTGGASVFLSPGVIWSPRLDWVVEASVQLPVVNALHGTHSESPVVLLASSVDF